MAAKKDKRESEHGSRYFHQADVTRELAVEYYESCFDDDGFPFDPDDVDGFRRAAAADKLFSWVLDIYEEALGQSVTVNINDNK